MALWFRSRPTTHADQTEPAREPTTWNSPLRVVAHPDCPGAVEVVVDLDEPRGRRHRPASQQPPAGTSPCDDFTRAPAPALPRRRLRRLLGRHDHLAAAPSAEDDQGVTSSALGAGRSGTDVMELPEPQGFVVRRKVRRARRGWYAPVTTAALTSTNQAAILNTALVAAPTDARGIVIGRDKLSNTLVAHDSFTAYEAKTITSPNVVVLGSIGSGKSSLLKTVYVLRPLIMRGRRAVVMDKKDENGEGEYCELARQYGAEPLRFVLGEGGTSLNIMDPLLLVESELNAGDGMAGQAALLGAVAELLNNGRPLKTWQKAALRGAHKATLRWAEQNRVDPLLEHLLAHLGKLHPEFLATDPSAQAKEKYHLAGLSVHHLLSALTDELSGLFDRPTSKTVRLRDRLTVFDISQLPDDGPATAMVMAVANMWLLGTLRKQRGLRTNFIAEEGWQLVGGPGGRVIQRNSKLARGLGLANVAALHHVADIPVGDPAIAMLKEAQTVHLYAQDRADDIDAIVSLYGLDEGSRSTLNNLAPGHHLLKIGNRREIHVQHVRSRLEMGITNTDGAMIASSFERSR